MRARRILAMIGIAVIVLLLAFPLREAVYGLVIVPIAYILWVLGLIYHSVHQFVWWILALLVVLVVLARSLWPAGRAVKRFQFKQRPVVGQVEDLAVWVNRTERGIYFKWLMANRLGRIAHEILLQREIGKPRSFFDPLIGPDWMPDAPIRQYLETGLRNSFADYPQGRYFFSRPKQTTTPLDHDLNDVIKYLESQAGNQ